MKFEYDERDDRGECVAYIDGDGDLVFRDYSGSEEDGIVFIANGIPESGYTWNPEEATHKFYPGDKLTITF